MLVEWRCIMAKKLSWYIDKYGEELGRAKHEQIRRNVGKSSLGKNALVGFIKRYGLEEGTTRFNSFAKKSLHDEESFILKYGEIEGVIKYKEYNISRSKGFKNTNAYWKDRGFTAPEIKKLIASNQNKTSLTAFVTRYGEAEGGRRYIENNKLQSFAISLAGFVLRYGEEVGEAKFLQYCKDSAVTLNNLIKKYGAEEGNIRWSLILQNKAEYHANRSKFGISRASLRVLVRLYKKLRKSGSRRQDIMWGVSKSHEWFLRYDTGIYFYDFCIPRAKIIVEYNGSHVHPDPRLPNDKQNTWIHAFSGECFEERRNKDLHKERVALDAGFVVFYIWDTDSAETIENTMEKIHECMFKK